MAKGPVDGRTAWLIAVHGDHSSFAHNIGAEPAVRLKIAGRWRDGTASITPWDEAVVGRFNTYARMEPRTFGIEPKLIRVELSA